MSKPSWLKDAIATPRGFVSKSGELLKARRMTQAMIDEFNGTKTAKAAPAPQVEEVESDLPEAEPEAEAPAPKKSKKKKSFGAKVKAAVDNAKDALDD